MLAGGIAAFVIAGVATVMVPSDGTSRLHGTERDVAEYALQSFDPLDERIGTVGGLTRMRVASVLRTRVDCPAAYRVTLKTTTWFGMPVQERKQVICLDPLQRVQ